MKVIDQRKEFKIIKDAGILKEPLVAVYGSLRRGLGNHNSYLRSQLLYSGSSIKYDKKQLEKYYSFWLGTYQTDKKYTMYSLGGFPGLVEGGEHSVVMEVYQLTDNFIEKKWQMLDFLEGYRGEDDPHNHYNKKDIETPWGTAKVYFLNNTKYLNKDSIVENGDWVDYLKVRRERIAKKIENNEKVYKI